MFLVVDQGLLSHRTTTRATLLLIRKLCARTVSALDVEGDKALLQQCRKSVLVRVLHIDAVRVRIVGVGSA